jgi:hypothetical protein
LLDTGLERAVRGFEGAMLVALAAMVAAGGHAIVGTQRRVASGEVLPLIGREVLG